MKAKCYIQFLNTTVNSINIYLSKMEQSYIPIFESFPLVSVIMPYYGLTHEMFCVLSILSVSIRQNLNDHYEEFRKYMLRFSKTLKIDIEKLSEMEIPSDIFKFKIDPHSLDGGVDDLITLIGTIPKFIFN